ncbi:hypothetical protein NKJ26_03145 [Mesorhizobium sp. M0152]|uniref:hypothetical protein n=1 Tax=Mesorhizobium sp. M0152 TaxID=2956898 RepID=UPI00333C5294
MNMTPYHYRASLEEQNRRAAELMGKTALAYEKVEHIIDHETPDNTGWWIVYYDPDGTSYDAIGPFDSHAYATEVHEGCAEEPDLCRAMASWSHADEPDPDRLRDDRDENRRLAREFGGCE